MERSHSPAMEQTTALKDDIPIGNRMKWQVGGFWT
jgi:hypothetical protein